MFWWIPTQKCVLQVCYTLHWIIFMHLSSCQWKWNRARNGMGPKPGKASSNCENENDFRSLFIAWCECERVRLMKTVLRTIFFFYISFVHFDIFLSFNGTMNGVFSLSFNIYWRRPTVRCINSSHPSLYVLQMTKQFLSCRICREIFNGIPFHFSFC